MCEYERRLHLIGDRAGVGQPAYRTLMILQADLKRTLQPSSRGREAKR